MPALECRDLVVRYGGGSGPAVTAVDGVSFTAEAGTVLALLGPNGAGKTTTVETLEGYKRPTAGTVRVLDLDPVADARALAPRIGVMLQRNGVYLGLGAAEVLRLFAAYYGTRATDPDELLARVDLQRVARTPWRRLSGGEQQRLSLALALVGRPDVVFLDEPTAGMDPAARQTLWGVITGLRDRGVCVLLTTHYLDEAERLADRVVIIDRGRVVAEGSPAELARAGSGGEIRFGAPPRLDVSALAALLGGPVAEDRPGEYVAAVPATPANVARLTAWMAEHDLPLGDLRAGRQRLEDVFLRLTGADPDPDPGTGPAPSAGRRSSGRRSRAGRS